MSSKATLRPVLSGWPALGIALVASAAWLALSAAAALRLGLIFHLHPAAALIGGAWLYRRLEGARPCRTRSLSFLAGALFLVLSYQQELAPQGVADPWPVMLAITLVGTFFAGRILLRLDNSRAAVT